MHPDWTRTEAVRPVALAVTVVGAETTGVEGGPEIAMESNPCGLDVPAALVTTQPSATVPDAPALKVIWLVVWPAVIVPPVMDQA